jgi:hypothetical protein
MLELLECFETAYPGMRQHVIRYRATEYSKMFDDLLFTCEPNHIKVWSSIDLYLTWFANSSPGHPGD